MFTPFVDPMIKIWKANVLYKEKVFHVPLPYTFIAFGIMLMHFAIFLQMYDIVSFTYEIWFP